jgi:hypothetical protein
MVPAERLPKNKKAEKPCAQGDPAINMNRIVFPSPSYDGLPLIGKFTEKYHLLSASIIFILENNHISQ